MSDDALFAAIEALQGSSWGSVLDAGTGPASLQWIVGLPTSRWTAITASEERSSQMRRSFARHMRAGDRLVIGNWTDPALLAGQRFDVVVADYLLGAVDGWAPYFQDRLFARLRPHVGGVLYVVGMEPFEDPTTEGGRLILQIARLRDACILLAGHRPYREYPLDWTLRRLEADGYEVESQRSVPIRFGAHYVDGQLDVCLRKLPHFADRGLARAMEQHVGQVRAQGLRLAKAGGIHFGTDYLVSARPR